MRRVRLALKEADRQAGRQVRRQRKSRAMNVGHGSRAGGVGGGEEREGGRDKTEADRQTVGSSFEDDASLNLARQM